MYSRGPVGGRPLLRPVVVSSRNDMPRKRLPMSPPVSRYQNRWVADESLMKSGLTGMARLGTRNQEHGTRRCGRHQGVCVVGPGELVFVEEAELHGRASI